MRALDIAYTGTGSVSQVVWAAQIYDAEIAKIQAAYDRALLRVADDSMPQKWADHWEAVLNDERTVGAITAFANQPASMTIDYKGYRGPNGSMSIAAAVEKIESSRQSSRIRLWLPEYAVVELISARPS